MELGLAGEGEGKGGRDPVLLACSRVLSSLPGRRQGHQQGRQSGQGAPAATVCTGGGHQGTTWLHLQGLQPGDPLLGPGSSGRCRCGLCSSPHRGLQTCWECKHRQPGCTSGCHLGGEADWPAASAGPGQWPAGGREAGSSAAGCSFSPTRPSQEGSLLGIVIVCPPNPCPPGIWAWDLI